MTVYYELWNFIKTVAHCCKCFLRDCWGFLSVWFMISCCCSNCAICLFPPEFVLKALTERVINHSMLHMIAEVFLDLFFLCQIQNQGNQEKSFNLICFEPKQRIMDLMFSLSKSNCKLMWTPQLPSPHRRSNDLTLNSFLIFGMCKSPWLFLIIHCLRIFSMTHPSSTRDHFSDSGTTELRCCCCDESRRLFVCLLAMNVLLLFISIAASILMLSSTINAPGVISFVWFTSGLFIDRDDTSGLIFALLIVFKHTLLGHFGHAGSHQCIVKLPHYTEINRMRLTQMYH